MTGIDFVVPARSWDSVEGVANGLRRRMGLEHEPHLPVIEIIELVLDQRLGLLNLEVGDHDEMGGAEGLTCPHGKFIMLRQDVYDGAWRGENRHRFTTAHELGHWAMHTNISMQRTRKGDGTPAYRLAEPQANQFAGAILMPKVFIDPHYDDEDDLMERFGVSRDAAANRLRYLRKKVAA
ncbi:ImmA/IrrE family metallo-endopeptidase [Paenirhodobacter populi]|uniref:ImmA/IrrE family metallo-endopeptidase n=1 Tax=Paenirhodobacter populi TaxID=2306993 RepID=A0A443JG68_9RHOB|nr:ImmA/IrrE family metallo-endopeptidase [Sinirhodobacter populi]RWR19492.1 ImmA/IrrE family metallo-endopeptidase [Sinirhodobacter populi]